jgi:hypothetical protein
MVGSTSFHHIVRPRTALTIEPHRADEKLTIARIPSPLPT